MDFYNMDLKKKILMIVIGLSIIVGVIAVGVKEINNKKDDLTITDENMDKSNNMKSPEQPSDKNQPQKEKSKIFVHVVGAVTKPDLYEVPEGARVYDVIMLAKPTKEAALEQINLAEIVVDGRQYIVPKKGQAISNSNSQTASSSVPVKQVRGENSSNKININTASEEELEELNGVGPALAKRIVEYRQANGGFKSIEDLKNVSGIGDKKYENMKNQVTL